MKKRNDCTLLIVDDNSDLSEAMQKGLIAKNFQTLVVDTGQQAVNLLKSRDLNVDLVICDSRMPGMNGAEVLRWVRQVYDRSFRNYQPLPFFLMSGFCSDINNEEIIQLQPDGMFEKPLHLEDLAQSICEKLSIPDIQNEKTDTPPADREFCKVSLEDFVSNKELNMDVFVNISKQKYLKVSHKGEKINTERIERYKSKGLRHLYIEKSEFRKVLDFNIMLSRVVKESDQVSKPKKLRFLAHTSETIMENTFVNGVDQESFDDAKDFLMTSMDLLTEDKDSFNLLMALNGHSNFLYAHSLGVSIYSVMIAKKLGWGASATLFKLSFGGLMHDIGKKEIDPELLEKPRNQLSYKEREHIETHPLRGKEILETLKAAPSDVVEIAYQHHENELGQGYPRRLSSQQIHPLAKIVHAADLFCGYALKNPNHPGVPAAKALHLLSVYKKDQISKEIFEALASLVADESKEIEKIA